MEKYNEAESTNECNYINNNIVPKFENCDADIKWFKDNNKWNERIEG